MEEVLIYPEFFLSRFLLSVCDLDKTDNRDNNYHKTVIDKDTNKKWKRMKLIDYSYLVRLIFIRFNLSFGIRFGYEISYFICLCLNKIYIPQTEN